MMTSTLLSIGILASMLVAPQSALAYLSPDDALYDDSFRFFEPPPSTRETGQRAATQREASAERRERELQAAIEESRQAREAAAQSSAASDDDSLRGAAPEQGSTNNDSEQLDQILQQLEELQDQQSTPEARREQRILERIATEQQSDLRGAATLHYGNNEPLRSGAPLTDTGPASTIAALLTAAAGLWTVRRSMQQKNAQLQQ